MLRLCRGQLPIDHSHPSSVVSKSNVVDIIAMSRPVSPAAGLCFISLVLTTTSLVLFSRKWANTSTVLKSSLSSPRETLLPRLSRAQCGALPYSPNLLPGARDVQTPYGVMRVYEWGPDSGRKVLLLHGDTTPSPMLGPIAMQLVERGCRVMLIGKPLLYSPAFCEGLQVSANKH